MRTTTAIIAVAMAAILIGCVPSLHPLYTGSDLVFDEGLVGDWIEEGEDEIWTFEKGGGGYYLTITEVEDDDEDQDVDEDDDAEIDDDDAHKADDDEVLEFRAFLFELDGRRFIDFYADPGEWSESAYSDLMLPMHWFGAIEIEDDHFDIAVMDGGKLSSMVEAGTDAPSYVEMDNYLLLTAPTGDLQEFVLDHIDDGIFSVNGRMFRK